MIDGRTVGMCLVFALVSCSREQKLAPQGNDAASTGAPSVAASPLAAADAGPNAPPADVTHMIAPIAASYDMPALAVAVFKNDRLLASGVTGHRKAGAPALATLEDKWVIGACSKTMTATLAAMLVDDGKLAFDDPLEKLLPGVPLHATRARATLMMLLQHHSGMERDPSPALLEKAAAAKDPVAARKELLSKLLLTASPQPTSTYSYSNVAYLVAGLVLERASGKPFETLIRERLFQPLGMASCGFGPPAMAAGGESQPSGHFIREGRVEAAAPGAEHRISPALAPTSSVHCTLADWAKFLRMHVRLPQGTETLATRESLKKIHVPAFNRNTAAGFTVETPEWTDVAISQFGSSGSFFANSALAPSKQLIFLVASNVDAATTREGADRALTPLFKRFAK